MNAELLALFSEDQEDRRGELPADLPERDRNRRQKVQELVATGALREPEDFFHAAMVFQHGETLDDYWRAYELAKKGAELGHRGARWLAAAAHDRWLMRQGKPQKYGTQYVSEGERWKLWEVDPATTDAERSEWNVPPLAEALRRADEMTRSRPPQVRFPAHGAAGLPPE